MKLKTNRKLNSVEKQMINELWNNGSSPEQISKIMQLDVDVVKSALPEENPELEKVNAELQSKVDDIIKLDKEIQEKFECSSLLNDEITELKQEIEDKENYLQQLENHLAALGFRDITELKRLLQKLDSSEFKKNKALLEEQQSTSMPSVYFLNQVIKNKCPQYVFNDTSCNNFKMPKGIYSGERLSDIYLRDYSYFEHIFKQNLITVLVMSNILIMNRANVSSLKFTSQNYSK